MLVRTLLFASFCAVASAINPLARDGRSDHCVSISLNLPDLFNHEFRFHPSFPGARSKTICICLSGLHSFIDADPTCRKAVQKASFDRVLKLLENELWKHHGLKECHYPDNAIPSCESHNPCAFECPHNWEEKTVHGKPECVCPWKLCNGVCQKHSCPSAKSKSKGTKRDEEILMSAKCPVGYMACGIWNHANGSKGPAYECIDVNSELESCGGCAIPLPNQLATGVDCSAIEGVADVSCREGQCHVKRCMKGFEVTESKSDCVKTEH